MASSLDPYTYEGLTRVFATEISRLQKGPLSVISDETERQKVLSAELIKLSADRRNFALALGRYFTTRANRPVIVAFDNVDILGTLQC